MGAGVELFTGYGNELTYFHRLLLADRIRTDSFLQALDVLQQPGMVVADIGTGTGVLAAGAAACGATRVYAVEGSGVAALAEEMIGSVGNVTIERAWAPRWTPPEPIDLLISECLDHWGISPMMDAVMAVVRSSVRPDGWVVPRRVLLHAALVAEPTAHSQIVDFGGTPDFLEVAPLRNRLLNCLFLADLGPDSVVSRAEVVSRVDLRHDPFSSVHHSGGLIAERTAVVHGLGGWFEAELAPGVTISTAPTSVPTVWRQVFLPFPKPLLVKRGDEIEVRLRAGHGVYGWSVRTGRDDQVIRGSTLNSYPDFQMDLSRDTELSTEGAYIVAAASARAGPTLPAKKEFLFTVRSSAPLTPRDGSRLWEIFCRLRMPWDEVRPCS